MSIAPETKLQTKARVRKSGPFFLLIAAFFSIELFAFFLLTPAQGRSLAQLWPLAFGLLWAVGLKSGPFFLLIAAFFSIELFAFFLLTPAQGRSLAQLWPLAFGLLWAVGLSCLLRLLPGIFLH